MSDVVCPKCGHRWSAQSLTALRCDRCGSTSETPDLAAGSALPSYGETLMDATPRGVTSKGRETTMRERAPSAWSVGDTILDLYDVIALLGRGGMGEVLRVRHRLWGIDLAVKTPRPEIQENPEGLAAFVHETETWADLGVHPHVVTCYYVRVIGGVPRIFAEFVEGGTLTEWIRSKKLYETPDPVARILDIAMQFAWGLHRAHEVGVIHQDVKPSNVMMTPDGVAKVTDFGLSKAGVRLGTAAAGSEETTTLVSVGGLTPAYASPEQWDRRPMSRRSDLWSWAVSVLEMFLGGTRWTRGYEAPASLSVADPLVPIPADVASLLRRCFAADQEKRPASLSEVAASLRALSGTTRREPKSGRAPADTLNNRALSMLDLGRPAEAERFFEQALAADPQHLQASYNRGLLRWRDGRWTDDALLSRLREIKASQPKREEIDRLIGLVQEERGDAVAVREQKGHRGPVAAVAIANGVVVTAGRDRTVRVGERAFDGHSDALNAVATDGRSAVSGGVDRTVRVWDLSTGLCRRVLTGHAGAVAAVAIAGRRVLSGGWDGALKLWDAETGTCTATWKGHADGVNAVAMTPDGLLAVTGGSDKLVRIWNLEQGRCIATLPGHTGAVLAVALSRDGSLALSGGTDQIIRVWNLATASCIRECEGHGDRVLALAMAGGIAVSGGRDRTVRVWELATGRCRRTIEGHTEPVLGIALEGEVVVSCGETTHVWRVPLLTAKAPLVIVRPRRSEDVSADDERVAAMLDKVRTAVTRKNWRQAVTQLATARGVKGYERLPEALDLWSEVARSTGRGVLRDAWQRAMMSAHTAPVEAVALGEDGRFAASAGLDKVVRLWDVATGKGLGAIEHGGGVTDVATDGRIVLSASLDSLVRVSDAGGAPLRMLKGHDGAVVAVGLAWGGAVAVTLGMDKTVRLWETATGASVKKNDGAATAVAISRDGKRIVTSASFEGRIHAIALSGDGRFAVTGGENGHVRLWNAQTNGCVRTMERHARAVNDVAIALDGSLIVSGGEDGVVVLWNGADGRVLRVLEGHAGGVTSVALAPDARTIVSAGRDRTVRLWHLDWNLTPLDAAHWHEGARPLLECAIACAMPFETLMQMLQAGGYGWLRPEGVKLKLGELKGH